MCIPQRNDQVQLRRLETPLHKGLRMISQPQSVRKTVLTGCPYKPSFPKSQTKSIVTSSLNNERRNALYVCPWVVSLISFCQYTRRLIRNLTAWPREIPPQQLLIRPAVLEGLPAFNTRTADILSLLSLSMNRKP